MNHDSMFNHQNRSLQKVVILGLARQGLALARFFVQAGKEVVLSDRATAAALQSELEALGDLPVTLVLGDHPQTLLDGCDLLCLSGGVPPQIPLVQEAIRRGIPLSNDSLLTIQLAKHQGLGPVIALTGSSGKTTTTTLVGQMLMADGYRVHVGGNIGRPLIDELASINPGEPILLELSSFQLELFDPEIAWGPFDGIGPDVAAILNITPNHLDRHPDMAAYTAAKLNLLRSLPTGGQVVLSADDGVLQQVAGPHWPATEDELSDDWQLGALVEKTKAWLAESNPTLIPFSRSDALATGAWLADGMLHHQEEVICPRTQVRLRGEHNVSNLLAAAAISGAVGATSRAMGQVARTFAGVPHRLEIVAQKEGITWINDSIATSPERAVAGLRSFDRAHHHLIVLAGGKDKNLPWGLFTEEALNRADSLIGFGEAGPMIIEAIKKCAFKAGKKTPSLAVAQRLEEAVQLAKYAVTANPAEKEVVILLSPGGTSFDAYKDFEERGQHFRQLVESF